MSDLPALVQYPKVDRIEVIDSTGRAFVAHYEAGAEVHIQHGGKVYYADPYGDIACDFTDRTKP